MKTKSVFGALVLGSALHGATASAGDVTIKRDGYGMAHVYADSVHDLFFGYGHAIAEDRLFSLDMARRTGTGEVAAVLGAEFVEFDRQIRENYWPAAVRAQLDDVTSEERDVLEGYAAGMNAWIAKVRSNPGTLMPREYLVHDAEPADWDAYDVAMVFVGSMLYRFGDYNTELDNAKLHESLVAMHGDEKGQAIFDTLLTRDEPDAPTTIPKGDWDPARRTAPDLELRPIESSAISDEILRRIAPPPPDFVGADGRTLPRAEWREHGVEALVRGGPDAMRYSAASNMTILGPEKLDGPAAVLVNGPQFGWYRPAYTWSVGLHGAGYDVAGNSVYGYPGIPFGHNGRIGWGSTWAAGDQVDLFRETLNPDDPAQYRHDGEWQDMETREETIEVNGGDPVKITVHRTGHGPVVARDEENGVAYAQKRAWNGSEIETAMSWVHLMKARDFDEFRDAVSRSAVNVNHYYADVDGNIGYVFGGAYPKRADGHDGRTPVSGEGEMDWLGIMPFSSNPHVLNPSNHRVINWNNRPAEGFPSPDQWWYSWMLADRVSVLVDEFEGEGALTPDEVWDRVVARASFEDVNAAVLIPFITEATSDLPADDPRRVLADQLAHWNLRLEDEDGDDRYDHPGATIMQTWLGELLSGAFEGTLPAPYDGLFSATGYPDPAVTTGSGQNIQVGTKVAHYALSGKGHDFFDGDPRAAVLAALEATRASLAERFGEDIAEWRGPTGTIRYNHRNFRGIPQTLPEQELDTATAMNRGTENNMIVFTGEGVEAWETVPPGQSGFIAPDGTTPHTYNDQLAGYSGLSRKRVWFTREEVEAHAASSETIAVP